MFPKLLHSAPLATLLISTAALIPATGEPTTAAASYAVTATQKTPHSPAPPPSYRLSPNDTVLIRVFQEQELDTTARIGKDGTIPFPLIGSIDIGGRTLPEASGLITKSLREYLVHPQISLRITEYNKRRFTVLGQVNRPGTFDMPEETTLTLLEGIGLAGGYNRIANPSKIIVKRHGSEGERIFRLDAKQMAKGRSIPPFFLEQGDTIIVEESLF
jgi:polysaccharide export outer membrane protein